MGQTLLGGTQMGPNIELLSPEQRNFLSGILGNIAPQAAEQYSQMLQPKAPGDYQELFQQTYVEPAQRALERQIIPSIQQSFVDVGAGSSSALNQALAEAATDVTSRLGTQMGQFMQGQQQLQLGALGQLGGLAGQRTFQPTMVQQPGALGPLLDAIIRGAGLFI